MLQHRFKSDYFLQHIYLYEYMYDYQIAKQECVSRKWELLLNADGY